MVKEKKTTPRKSTTKLVRLKHSDAQKRELFSEISKEAGKRGMSERKAIKKVATKWKMSWGTVNGLYNRMKAHPGRAHGSRLLTDEQELALATIADARSLLHIPYTKREFIAVVHELHPSLAKNSLQSWFEDFARRWKSKISVRAAKRLSEPRVHPETLPNVKIWVQEFPAFLKRHGLKLKNIVNTDESRIRINLGPNGETAINTTRRNKASREEAKSTKYGTYLPFATPGGDIVMDVFIIPADMTGSEVPLLTRAAEEPRGANPTYWATSSSGYLDGDLWMQCVAKFKEVWSDFKPGVDSVILTDNLSAHREVETIKWCLQNRVHVFFLPANVTHFLNPLDNLCFTAFKRQLTNLIIKGASTIALKRQGLARATLEAATEARVALTPKVIKASWARVGIFPWDEDKILKEAKLNIAEISTEPGKKSTELDRATKRVVEDLKKARDQDQAADGTPAKKRKKMLLLFSGESIIAESQRQAAANKVLAETKAKKRTVKAKAKSARHTAAEQRKQVRVAHTCRGPHPNPAKPPVFRNGSKWTKCKTCDAFYLCPRCSKTQVKLLKNHQEEHQVPKSVPAAKAASRVNKTRRLVFTTTPLTH